MGKIGDLSKRREKVKELSEGRTMSSDFDNSHIRRKFKLPKKVFCGSIPIHPASVPRKLRSAISKRSCKPASVPMSDFRTDRLKKSKMSMNGFSNHYSRRGASVTITKEEEEVAETLFALAGLIPLNNGESSGSKASISARNSRAMSSSQDHVISKEEQGSAYNQTSSDATNVLPAAESSKLDSVQAKSLTETTLSCPKLSERRQLNHDLKVSVPPTQLHRIPPLLRACDDRQLASSATISQISQRGFSETETARVLHPKWQSPQCVDPQALNIASFKKMGHDASGVDNGLMSRSLCGFGLDGLPQTSSTIAFPAWVNPTASSSRPCTLGESVAVDKVPRPVNFTKRKRCMTHVYISHLIQGMEIAVGKDNQLRPPQWPSIAADRNDLRGTPSSYIFGSTMYKNICEAGVRVPMNLEHQGAKDEGSKNQSFDFLSLSPGVGAKATGGANRLGNCLEANCQVPDLHSVSQASAPRPCSNLQNCFPFKACQDQVALASMTMPPVPPQVHMQMRQYFANNAIGTVFMPHMGAAKSTSLTQPMSQQQQQQQQQQIWTSQLAAQFRPRSLLPSQITNWQNSRQDPRTSTSTQHIEPQVQPSQPSLEMTGAKYLHITQQQQQLIARCPPLPLSNAKPQSDQLPSVCEDKGVRFQPDGVRPFQLLCNERL